MICYLYDIWTDDKPRAESFIERRPGSINVFVHLYTISDYDSPKWIPLGPVHRHEEVGTQKTTITCGL